MAFTKVVLHQLGSGLCDPKVRANVVHHFLDVYRTDTAQGVGLHILVQQFIGIQFRTVRRQAEYPNLLSVLGQPTADRSRLVYRMAIHNQKHLPPGLPCQAQQAAEKIQKHPRRETLTENHEGQSPAIGNCRDHVAAKTLAGAEHHRRLSAASVAASRLVIRTQSHLVQPMNLGLKPSCLFANRWVFFRQPFPHGHRILLVRSSHRLLRSQPPGSQIAPHRPHRNL